MKFEILKGKLFYIKESFIILSFIFMLFTGMNVYILCVKEYIAFSFIQKTKKTILLKSLLPLPHLRFGDYCRRGNKMIARGS